MSNPLSHRVQAIKPSPTLAVTQKAQELRAQGHDIIGLGTGEPDFDTPEHIRQAAIEAIHSGQTRYTAVDGTPALKQAIIDKFERDNHLHYTKDQILVSSGGKQSFFNLALALLNAGDEVIIPAPYWVSYPDMVLIAEGKPIIIPTGHAQRFKINADQLRQHLTPATKLVVINSPSNPSGVAYTRAELTALAEVLREYPNVFIATDDMYEHILWADEPFANILTVAPDLFDRTFVLNGVSKAYAMTGWRIGYAGGPKSIIAAMKKVQSQSTSNPCSVSQAAAVAALAGSQDCIKPMLTAFKSRHDYLHKALNQLPAVHCESGDGTFYLLPSVHACIDNIPGINDDVAFADFLLQEAKVAVVPGSAFGAPGYIRLSFATSMDALQEAISR
ncbi:MAG: pyridoxal phosphate-dependent aminotransferase, partial [Gammaproteobacteria bacterium]